MIWPVQEGGDEGERQEEEGVGAVGMAGHVCTLVIVIHNNKIRRESIPTVFGGDTPDPPNHKASIAVFLGALGGTMRQKRKLGHAICTACI